MFEKIEKFLENFSAKMDELREENEKLNKKLYEDQKEAREQIREIREAQKEEREQIRELREAQKEAQKEAREQIREIREAQKETERQLRKTDRKYERTMEMWKGFLGNYGQATEERFYRSLESTMKLGEIKFDEIERWVQINSRHTEFDILLFNGECVGIVEVKSKAHPEEVKSLTTKKTERFKKDFPEYSNHKLYFGLASLVTNNALIQKAKEEGIFLLTQKGDHLEIVNDNVRSF